MDKRNILKIIFMTILMSGTYIFSCLAAGWVSDGGGNWSYVDKDGIYATNTIRASGDEKYYLDENGFMVRDYLLEDYNEAVYYFDDDGKMVKNTWVAVDITQVYNQMDNPPSIYLYYFGNNGKAYKSINGIIKKVIDGKKYLFNDNGQMLSGWIDEEGNCYNEFDDEEAEPYEGFCYYAGDETDGVLREGWTAWEEGSIKDRYYLQETMWFYFKTNDNKKYQSNDENVLVRKTINGKVYSFDHNGVMTQGWDAEALDPTGEDANITAKSYFNKDERDIGRLTKREWIFAVPSIKQDQDDHDADIERWFYAAAGGDVIKGVMKKINNDYYAFNDKGIMKTGLCVIDRSTKTYVDCIDAEKTDGKDFIVSRHYISVDKSSAAKEYEVFNDKTQVIYYFEMDETDTANYGKRRFINADIPFGDADYEFTSKNTGEYEGLKKKKYYQNGIKLRADATLGLGLVFAGYSSTNTAVNVDYDPVYYNSTHIFAKEDKNHINTDGSHVKSDYIVIRDIAECQAQGAYPVFYAVDTAGNKITKSNIAKKDKSGNYWLIQDNGTVLGIFEVPIRYHKAGNNSTWQYKSEKMVGDKIKSTWINFGEYDQYNKTCGTNRDSIGGYALYINDAYALNFRYADD